MNTENKNKNTNIEENMNKKGNTNKDKTESNNTDKRIGKNTGGKNHKVNIGIGALLVAVAGLYACAYDPAWDETSENSPAPVKTNAVSALNASVEELPEPNAYQVRLRWPKDAAASHFTLARENLKSGETIQVMTLTGDASEYADRAVKPGISYRYHLGRHGTDAFTDLRVEAAIPLDFIVSGAQIVNRVGSEFNRLWILPNSTILTHGNDLKVEVNQLLAGDNAAIDTAPPSAWAAPNTSGKSGGSVVVHAKTATGRLKVFATGQGGGQGNRGGDGASGGKGPKGISGTTRREVDGSTCERHCPARTVCDRSPGNGGQGEQGRPGGHGSPGHPGGDSARVLIAVDMPNGFEVIPSIAPGPGGPGGIGGTGGSGGLGGDPGDRPSVCQAARPGPIGLQGLRGPTGSPGADGKKQPVCLKLGQSLVGDCSGFADMTR